MILTIHIYTYSRVGWFYNQGWLICVHHVQIEFSKFFCIPIVSSLYWNKLIQYLISENLKCQGVLNLDCQNTVLKEVFCECLKHGFKVTATREKNWEITFSYLRKLPHLWTGFYSHKNPVNSPSALCLDSRFCKSRNILDFCSQVLYVTVLP